MQSQKSLELITTKNQVIWLLMAFQAGAINVGGFLACHRFVTHTTGFATHFGVEVANGHWQLGLGMLFVPIFFLFGSMAAGLLVDRQLYRQRPPLYNWVFGLILIILVGVSAMGQQDLYGQFGSPLSFVSDFALLAPLSFASGLQNAAITSASGAVIRTTHLTGLTTDLGIGIARVLDPRRDQTHRIHESKLNQIRMLIIASFVLGSGLGALLFLKLEYLGFVAPASVSLALLLLNKKSVTL